MESFWYVRYEAATSFLGTPYFRITQRISGKTEISAPFWEKGAATLSLLCESFLKKGFGLHRVAAWAEIFHVTAKNVTPSPA